VSLRPALLLPAALLLLGACTREQYRNADLQLDILGALPSHADRVRICVEDLRSRTVGAGGDRYAVPGLPVGEPATVIVDALVEREGGDSGLLDLITVARSTQVTFTGDDPWLETELEVFADDAEQAWACNGCPTPCGVTATAAETEEESWLLTVRFQG
jgi:hypothetical protein